MQVSLQHRVIAKLREGDQTLGDMREAFGCSYPELHAAMNELRSKELVEYYFRPGIIQILTYRLNYLRWQAWVTQQRSNGDSDPN